LSEEIIVACERDFGAIDRQDSLALPT